MTSFLRFLSKRAKSSSETNRLNKHQKLNGCEDLKEALDSENISGKSVNEILTDIDKLPKAIREKVKNNGGGHYNHELFWKCMQPAGSSLQEGMLKNAINSSFGSYENFKNKLSEAAMTRFGSGWAWLYVDDKKSLQIGSTPNQDNPLMDVSPIKGAPILGLDVWEHAYYLKYQNRRAEYVSNWFNIVNWKQVENNLLAIGK